MFENFILFSLFKEEIGLMMTGTRNLLELYPEKNYGFAEDSLLDKKVNEGGKARQMLEMSSRYSRCVLTELFS